MELFQNVQLTFEKVAAETALPEDPNAWPHEVLQELFKQVPYIADFEPHIIMDKVDAERGYGFGYVQVMNKTELQENTPPDALQAAGVRQARIPVIIRDMHLQPFDVMVTDGGKSVPLTEDRLRQAIFRPQAFDVTSKTPGDQSLIGQLYPPFRQNYGGGGGVTMSVGMGKEGSVLDRVLPTAYPGDHDRFVAHFHDRSLSAAYAHNAPATIDALRKIARVRPTSLDKRASVLPSIIRPSVVQIRKEAQGYSIKSASHAFWEPIYQTADRGEVVRRFGDKVALAADVSGSATLADGAEASEPSEEESAIDLIKDFGIYRVEDEHGQSLVGYVFPNLVDLDGTALPMALFTNGSQVALQGEVAGARVGDAVPVHEGRPYGKGCFFFMGDNEAHATVPVEVHADLTDEDGAALMASTIDGRQVQVRLEPSVDVIQLVDETLLVPSSYKWLSLEGAEEVSLVGMPGESGKQAHARSAVATVTVRSDGQSFSVEGMATDKLAAEETQFLSVDGALFLLAGLGTDLDYGLRKLGQAARGVHPVEVRIGRLIKTARDQLESAKEAGMRLAGAPGLKRVLVKEAAVIPDPTAVDTVLSLGFVNDENILAFVSCLPKLEEAQQHLCELLIAARIGMQDIPVPALEKAVQSLEEVLEGLKVIAFQKN